MFPDVGGVQLNGRYTVIFDDRAMERILQQKEPEPGIPQWSIWLTMQHQQRQSNEALDPSVIY